MKPLGEAMVVKAPTDEQREILLHVTELAEAWQAGRLPLAGVRAQCSGHERFTAIRCAPLDSPEKHAIMALIDALVAEDEARQGAKPSKHGRLSAEELRSQGAVIRQNWKGERVTVWPLFWMNGQAHYPHVELEPGPEREAKERAMLDMYRAYRDASRSARRAKIAAGDHA
jgi:hypothetical protein